MKRTFFLSVELLFVLALMVASVACVSRRDADQIATQRDSLNNVVQEKDALLSDIFSSLNIVSENLNIIKERENIVSSSVSGDEIPKGSVARINEDVAALDKLIEQNKQTIAQLKSDIKRLKQTAVQVSSLEAMVARLQEDNAKKSAEIVQLKKQISELESTVDNLSTELAADRERIDTLVESHVKLSDELTSTNDMLYTAYYVVGNKKELINQQVIERSKKLFGEMKINTQRSLDIFTRINTRTFTVLPIEQQNVEVLSSHPADSYRLVWDTSHKVCRELEILDPERFWSLSKVLVVSYK